MKFGGNLSCSSGLTENVAKNIHSYYSQNSVKSVVFSFDLKVGSA